MTTHKKRRALLTGTTGQDGSYLAELLLEKDYQVFGMARRSSSTSVDRIQHLLGEDALELVEGDLADSSSLHRLVRRIQPDELYNLGAQSHVKVSFDVPEYTGEVTGLGVVRLLEAIREHAPACRFYQASSSELFGKVVETPQKETTPFSPRSPYAVAKAYAYYITRNYREAYGTFALNGILFNHESPRRGLDFVTRKISSTVAAIKNGDQDALSLGNLDAKRDWGFAGDYVDAMWRMLQTEEPEDYVVATGECHSVRDYCDIAFARVGLPLTWQGEGLDEVGVSEDGRVLVRVDERFFRPAEVDFLLGDATKARRQLGWSPKVSFRELVEMMVDADCAQQRREQPAGAVAGREG